MSTQKTLTSFVIAFALSGLISVNSVSWAAEGTFTVSSPQIAESSFIGKEQVFAGFGCTGQNVSPELKWENIPAGTKSIAVTAYDPDAPTGSGWWHWVVVNLPADTNVLEKDAGTGDSKTLPEGALQVRTDFGVPGYGGPCPPEGDHAHRYFFNVHALDVERLDVDENVAPALVGFYLNFHTIAKASLMGLYRR
jgi:Raf kinase inhibitor-like YbhB/YbcL family protein